MGSLAPERSGPIDGCVVAGCGVTVKCSVYGGPPRCLLEHTVTSDSDDENIRRAHGIPYTANWQDPAEVCRNGCGTTYHEIIATKMSRCPASVG